MLQTGQGLDRLGATSSFEAQRPRNGSKGSQGMVEPDMLRSELERLQQQQREEEVDSLQKELDQITEEANKRIEKGNDSIVELKNNLRNLRDVDAPKLQREFADAQRMIETARAQNSELK